MNVLALDLSLTATGVAYCDGSTDTWKVATTGVERLIVLRDRITSMLDASIDVVAIEGFSFGSKQSSSADEIYALGWTARLALHDAGMPYAVIPPSNVKKFATGKGAGVDKSDMRMALFQRFAIDNRDDNQVDAFWLRAMTLDHYGEALVQMPALHRDALAKVAWPELAVAA